MEVYVLDGLLRRDRVIDRFESLIWTERFNEQGDFELDIFSTIESRSILKNGTLLALNESYRVMKVETVKDVADADGRRILKISGRSLEAILQDRVAKESTEDLTTSPTWDITDVPSEVARKIFHDICVTGILSSSDIIPFVIEGSIMPPDSIDEPVDPMAMKLPPTSVYDAIKAVCEVWTLGFRLLRNFDASELYFDIYAGTDRTTGQSVRAPVVFSPELDNLQNTTELTTIEGTKNVAYVFSPNGFLEVYPRDVEPEIEGFDRQVLVVQADDITLPSGAPGSPELEALEAALTQRGREELSKYRAFQAFDGEINPNSQYKYQRDYYLGDLVEQRNTDGVSNRMRVTEQIFVSDKEGDRAYPTLTLNTFVNTGTWLAEGTKVWFDYEADPITWSEK